MTETARMCQPLSAEEVAAAEPGHDQKPKPVPIVPVPADAPPMQYRHREHGGPTSTWAYHNAQGQIVGYILRWDFTGSNGKPAKDILPVCYCNLSDGRRAWRSVGMPAPRPLLRLPDVLARSSARVLVPEGEQAADAAARADQAETIARHGGREAIIARGTFGYTPAPGEVPAYK